MEGVGARIPAGGDVAEGGHAQAGEGTREGNKERAGVLVGVEDHLGQEAREAKHLGGDEGPTGTGMGRDGWSARRIRGWGVGRGVCTRVIGRRSGGEDPTVRAGAGDLPAYAGVWDWSGDR